MALTALPNLITLPDAAKRLQKSVLEVRSMAESGEIEAGVLPNGDIVVTAESLPQRKEELPEYKQNAHLKGNALSISAAARKYEISLSTVHQWVQYGYISRLGTKGNRVLVDEADVAYCVTVYRLRGSRPKRRIFNSDGTPYNPQTETLAA